MESFPAHMLQNPC